MEALFPFRLPPCRLGKSYPSLKDMQSAVDGNNYKKDNPKSKNFNEKPPSMKEYSLILVTEPSTRRILLGLKQRGFGKGMYNLFGGKLESKDETILECAVRELKEETGISVPVDSNILPKVATLYFTFDDDDNNNDNNNRMLLHVFRLNVKLISEEESTENNGNISNDEKGKETKGGRDIEEGSKDTKDHNFSSSFHLNPKLIRECDEITPEWFSDWYQLPLNNMFADDSLWLTRILASEEIPLYVDGHFHFEAGGQDVNTVQHYFMDIYENNYGTRKRDDNKMIGNNNNTITTITPTTTRPGVAEKKKKLNLERRLFRALQKVPTPSTKEFNEAFAFVNAVQNLFGKRSFDVVLDVAGGHGALGALFLILSSANTAVIIDPARVGSVRKAWGDFLPDNSNDDNNKFLRFRHECLRTGLPAELIHFLKVGVHPSRILVVACHACQHLSEETLRIALSYGAAAAVMPCCQRDPTHSWKRLSKNLNLNMGLVMDLLLAGKCMSFSQQRQRQQQPTHTVRMKIINSKITPQNRIILCRPDGDDDTDQLQKNSSKNKKYNHSNDIDKAHKRLERAYHNAHKITASTTNIIGTKQRQYLAMPKIDITSLIWGVAIGSTIVLLTTRRQKQ